MSRTLPGYFAGSGSWLPEAVRDGRDELRAIDHAALCPRKTPLMAPSTAAELPNVERRKGGGELRTDGPEAR